MSVIDGVLSRIGAIEERIADLSGPVDPPAQMAGSTFASALQTASATPAPLLGPDGEPVRPLTVADLEPQVSAAADKYGVDPKLVQAVIQVESSGDPNAVSRAGAMGLMQLMPDNVKEAGVTDPFDPAQNIDAGTKQLAGLLSQFGGNLDLALAGYNAGPGAVRRFGGIPPYPETQSYVRKIRALLDGS